MSEEKIPDGYTELRKVYESLQNEYAELRQEMKDGLRDHFAAAALQGLCASFSGPCLDDEFVTEVVSRALDVADAMLAARERKEEGR